MSDETSIIPPVERWHECVDCEAVWHDFPRTKILKHGIDNKHKIIIVTNQEYFNGHKLIQKG